MRAPFPAASLPSTGMDDVTNRSSVPIASRETTAVTRTCPPILSAASVPGIRNEPGNSPTETTSVASGSLRTSASSFLSRSSSAARPGRRLLLDGLQPVEARLREGLELREALLEGADRLVLLRDPRPASRSAPSARRSRPSPARLVGASVARDASWQRSRGISSSKMSSSGSRSTSRLAREDSSGA